MFWQNSRKTRGEIAKLWLFENRICRVGKGALRAVPTIRPQIKMVGTLALCPPYAISSQPAVPVGIAASNFSPNSASSSAAMSLTAQ
jgi:hypothetical protein